MTGVVDRAIEAHEERLREQAEKRLVSLSRQYSDSLDHAKEVLGPEVGELDFEGLGPQQGVRLTLESGHRVRAYHDGRQGTLELPAKKGIWLERPRGFWKRIYVKSGNVMPFVDVWPWRLRPKTYEVEVLSLSHLGALIEDDVRKQEERRCRDEEDTYAGMMP